MRKLAQGNEAVFRGAIAAGAGYYAGYPFSPSTEILNVASGYAASGYAAEHPEFKFLQAEDEIGRASLDKSAPGGTLSSPRAAESVTADDKRFSRPALVIVLARFRPDFARTSAA